MVSSIGIAVEDLDIDGMLLSYKRSEDIHRQDLQKRVIRYFPELEKHIVSIIENYCIPGIEREPQSCLVITNDKRFIASYNLGVDMMMLKEVKND